MEHKAIYELLAEKLGEGALGLQAEDAREPFARVDAAKIAEAFGMQIMISQRPGGEPHPAPRFQEEPSPILQRSAVPSLPRVCTQELGRQVAVACLDVYPVEAGRGGQPGKDGIRSNRQPRNTYTA